MRIFAAYRSDPEVARYQSWSAPYSLKQARALHRDIHRTAHVGGKVEKYRRDGRWTQLAIADRGTDLLVGDLALKREKDGSFELGITVQPRLQGKGVAREAAEALLSTLRGKRVVAVVDERNEPARRLLGKLGFRAQARTWTLFKGKPCVELLYGLH